MATRGLDPKIARAVFERDGWKCRHCQNRNGLHPHHIIFKSHGGLDALNNLITLCSCCHIEGIHRGHLKLDFIKLLEYDVVVRFTRIGKWRPR